MDNEKQKLKQPSVHSRDITVHQSINIKMLQNVLLIWLDNSIDEDNNVNCRNMIIQLRSVINTIKTFTDTDECVDFLTNIYDEKVCMIISDALCQNAVPLIHDFPQLHTIFIFGEDKAIHEQWAQDWFKIKGIFTKNEPISQALKVMARECEDNAIPISFINTHGGFSGKNLDQLDPLFMYTQIFKEILLTIRFDEKHIMDFIKHCREAFADNESGLKRVDEFQQKYHNETPIWWYTYQSFLYSMLNRGLRLMDVDIIIKMGFFIDDLHLHIEQLHREQINEYHSKNIFTVYRGQGISKTEFEQMKKTTGGLLSFNNFLSTSKDRSVSLLFAESNSTNPNLVGILFVMTIDPFKSSTPFASINDVGYFREENEVLFSMLTVFRICAIKPMDENNRLYQVELTLTSDDDQDLRQLTDQIHEEAFPNVEGWPRLALLLLKLDQTEKAQQVYEILLEEAIDEDEKSPIYVQIGLIKDKQGKYDEAMAFYEKSLKIDKKTLPSNHPDLGMSYNNIGGVYYNMGDYAKALSFYEKALQIQQQSLPPNHPDLGGSYNNIGAIHCKMGDYEKALLFYEKALEILKQSLPSNHPCLSASYSNIGMMYNTMGDYSKALASYEKALEIQQHSLPPNHPSFGSSYINIGSVYANMGEYETALSYYEKALTNQQALLPPNHPNLGTTFNQIGAVHYAMGEYSKALSSYEKALEIRQQSLPPNHPDLGASYNNIGNVSYSMSEYSEALLSYEKALEIQQQSLPSNHPSLGDSYNNIGNAHADTGDYSKALSYYIKALDIRQQSLPSNHPILGNSYNNIGLVYAEMGEYAKAISSYRRALEIQEQSLPPNHPAFSMSYNNIGNAYFMMGNVTNARLFYERAVDIGQHSLPSNHPRLELYKNNLDRVK